MELNKHIQTHIDVNYKLLHFSWRLSDILEKQK